MADDPFAPRSREINDEFADFNADEYINQHDSETASEASARIGSSLAEIVTSHDGCESLRSLRLRAGLTQAALSRLSGIDQPHLSRIEGGGVRNLRLETLESLARALDCDLNSLGAALRITEKG